MSMLDSEWLASPTKKQKYNNANEGGVIFQNNCAVINVIGSTAGSTDNALRLTGDVKEDVKEDKKVLKDE